MALNENLLNLHRNLKDLKINMENNSQSDLENLIEETLKNTQLSIHDFLKEWENIECDGITDCIEKFSTEGYLPLIHKENILKFLSKKDISKQDVKDLYKSLDSIFEIIYYEYRFG